jgi:hypothetical protein
MACNGLDDGRVDTGGRECNKVYSRYRAELTIVDRHLYVAGVPWQPTAAAQVHDGR